MTDHRDMTSKFAAWLTRQPKGTLTRLMYATRLSWNTLIRARAGSKLGLRSALLLSRATNGEVPVAALTDEVEALPVAAVRPKRRGPRKRRAASAA